jgi:hypothetical protein
MRVMIKTGAMLMILTMAHTNGYLKWDLDADPSTGMRRWLSVKRSGCGVRNRE